MARFPIYEAEARGILTRTSGFIAAAGFTHSLTPARNCTFGCTYCYVPTMGIYGGLKPEDWKRWGQFTTIKTNAATLLRRELRAGQIIYCSPLVDPYQPAEAVRPIMPDLLDELIARPPAVFVIQTRGPLILRDIDRIKRLARITNVRISFSVTTDRDDIRRLYEPLCATMDERLHAMQELGRNGLDVFATLAPLLPCDPEALVTSAITSSNQDIIGDPLHVRAVKRTGATTKEAAHRIAALHGHTEWFDPTFQRAISERIAAIVDRAGRKFATGPEGFSWLARN